MKKYSLKFTFIEATLSLAVFILLYIIMPPSPTRYVIAINFCITLSVFIYMTMRSRRRIEQAVRRLSDEISTIPEDLSDKVYDHIQDETRVFYEELTRVKRLLDKRSHNRQELLDIVNTVASNMELNQLLNDLLPRFNKATRSNCSAFYTVNHANNKLEIKHSVGFSKNIYNEFDLTLGEGFIGQAAFVKDVTLYNDVPEDTVYYIRTFLGQIKPRSLMVAPISSRDRLTGVLVCASIYEYTREDREMIELIRYYMGVAVTNSEHFEQTRRLTNELTFQNKLIHDQHEVMLRRLDEKTQLSNYLINHLNDDCQYALDEKGIVLAWNRGAEQLHNINSPNALGRAIEKLYAEHGWPALTAALQSAYQFGSHTACFWRPGMDGDNRRYEIKIKVMRNDLDVIFGTLVHIKEVE